MISQSVSQSGIPIGNLTSQIFANVYLNELDRYVRHVIKPLGYVRYGDDIVVFCTDQAQAMSAQRQTVAWLDQTLKLQVHTKNNVIVAARQGVRFLGHHIYPYSPLSVEPKMARKISANLTVQNMASYKAMHLTAKQRKVLPWLLSEKNS